jgi:hypothetical protein
MRFRQIVVSTAFAAGLAALPVATAKAQYYPPCSPFPLFWPFCVAGAIVGTAATIVAAPFVALTAPPYYYGLRFGAAALVCHTQLRIYAICVLTELTQIRDHLD